MHIVVDYEPLAWSRAVHTGNYIHGACVGGLGSSKSTTCLQELKALAIENPGFTYLIGRKHLPSLRDTTLRAFNNIFEPGLIASFNQANLVARLINGSEFIFRPLDDPEKMKSLEIAGFFVNEANEIDKETYDTLKSRVRQKVNGKQPTRYRTLIDLNPCERDHWIPRLFIDARPADHKLFHSATTDNLKNLPVGYLEMLQNTYTEEEQESMILGFWKTNYAGRPVFPAFKGSEINYINPHLKYNPAYPMMRGWDFGFNHPTVVWAQFIEGRVNVLAECLGREIYLHDFIPSQVIATQNTIFGKLSSRIIDFCDPRGSDSSDKGASSVDILREHGIYPTFRRTWIEEGLKATNHYMTTKHKDGRPNFQIHPQCKNLVEGYRGGYARAEGSEMPIKDNKYDNAQDAARYVIIHAFQRAKVKELNSEPSSIRVYVNPVTGVRREY